MSIDLFESVRECGCAAKLPPQDLCDTLRSVPIPTSPAVLIGPEALDDAGVYRLGDGACLVQTVDFFPPVARAPEDYGRIAAANALSDIYAMGGKPLCALAIVCCPLQFVKEGALAAVLRGAGEKLQEAGCVLLGGHSVLDPQPKFGLAVTGISEPEGLFSNARARAGDLLFLSKPLGTGTTLMAVRAGMASAEQERMANRSMAELNRKIAELARRCDVRSATDITGFGLLGHAMQLARASGVALELDADNLPMLDGALDFARQGLLAAATYTNRAYVGDAVQFDDGVALPTRDLLFDPQTSGGLLIACPADHAEELVALARRDLRTPSAIIGRVVEAAGKPLIRVGWSRDPGGQEGSKS